MVTQEPQSLIVRHEGLAEPVRIAAAVQPGRPGATGLVWLGGFKSAMNGTKACALADWALANDRPLLRFDYSGHGRSTGTFTDGTIGRWLAETLAVIEAFAPGPRILVGSSMGGWLALLATLALNDRARIKGLVLIAPATDFTEALMWRQLAPDARDAIQRTGLYLRPSAYDDGPYPITRQLIEEGRDHLLLGGPIPVHVPVRILHGQADPDVPWQHGQRLVECLETPDVVSELVKDGDHRLSRPRDIARLKGMIGGLLDELDGTPSQIV